MKHLKTSPRKSNFGRKRAIQIDSEPKHTSKVMANWLKKSKVKVLEWPSQIVDLSPIQGGLQT